jgi:hypothetical protein
MAYSEKYIASSVFVNSPTGTILGFGNGIPFSPLANEAVQVYNQFVNSWTGDYYMTNQNELVNLISLGSGNFYLPQDAQSWADITISNFTNEAATITSPSGQINYLGNLIGTQATVPANTCVRFVRNDAGEWVMIPQYQNVVRNAVIELKVADILAMKTTPIVLLPATLGVAFEPLALSWKIFYNTTAYDVTGVTSIDLNVGSSLFFQDTSLNPLNSGTTTSFAFPRVITDAIGMEEFKDVTISCAGANPTLGDSTVTVELLYKINTFA